MKTVALLTLLVAAMALMGCTTDPCKEECCGRFNANCCGWEFYKPCNPLRSEACGHDLVACPTRVVVQPCEVVEAAPEAAPEATPAPADEGVAEYGAPPAGR